MQQVREEQIIFELWWVTCDAETEAERLVKALRNKVSRSGTGCYKRFPQEDGSTVFLTSWRDILGDDAQKVPDARKNPGTLRTFVSGITGTPRGKRISGTRKFGGDFRHMRGSKNPDDVYIAGHTANKVLEFYGRTGANWSRAGNDTVKVYSTAEQNNQVLEDLEFEGVLFEVRR